MEVSFLKEKTKLNYENDKWLDRSFGIDVRKGFKKFLEYAGVTDNLWMLYSTFRGLRIEYIKGSINPKLYSARLNKDYRVEFIKENKIMKSQTEITIKRIHPHDY
ncbi:MAG: hypothetical protein GY679_03385 [Mycoplasma sp.]|nr:hypothetical protein [Mycoplasma sp.]